MLAALGTVDSSGQTHIPTLLATKLFIPSPRERVVPRPRLLELLDRSLRAQFILVSAPPGFGKTTLLSSWLAKGEFAAAWVSLDSGDNDPTRFANYLIAALQKVSPGVGAAAQAQLNSPQPPPLESILTMLINALCTFSGDAIIVLDDYHVVDSQTVHNAVAFIL
jgi:LuxR family maltose regulon positive regulatory protein